MNTKMNFNLKRNKVQNEDLANLAKEKSWSHFFGKD